MKSTMQEAPLTLTDILQRGRTLFPGSQVVTFEGEFLATLRLRRRRRARRTARDRAPAPRDRPR